MDNHAVLPPEYQAGGESTREHLRQQNSERVNKKTPGASSSGQLETAGPSSSGRPVAMDDLSSAKKVQFHPQIDGEKYIGKFDDLAKIFQAAESGGAREIQSSTGQYLCIFW